MPEPPLDPDLAALSTALGGLAPAPPALDRDRLFFEAGRRAVRPHRGGWQLAACGFAVLSAALGARLATQPEPTTVVRVVYVPTPVPPVMPDTPTQPEPSPAGPPRSDVLAAEPRPAGATYLRLRDQVVRFGADTLPARSGSAPVSVEPLERLLGLPRGSLDDALKARWNSQLSRGDV
jgi:hypothetical protein